MPADARYHLAITLDMEEVGTLLAGHAVSARMPVDGPLGEMWALVTVERYGSPAQEAALRAAREAFTRARDEAKAKPRT